MISSAFSFTAPGGELDQGDLIRDIPHGVVDAPITICRPESDPVAGRGTFRAHRDTPNAFKNRPEKIHATSRLTLAVVLWHGCQIDKFKGKKDGEHKAFAAIAPVFLLSEIAPRPEHREAILEGRHMAFFPMPALKLGELDLPASCVDMRYIWSVRQSVLLEEGRRVAQMSSDLRAALFGHMFTFFTRTRPARSTTCGHCGGSVSLALDSISDD